MLRIGFNGKSRAKPSIPKLTRNGEDVNIGWHERMKTLLGGNQIDRFGGATQPVTNHWMQWRQT